MTRTISIRSTPLLKFVLAPIWLFGAAYATWILWAHPERVLDDYRPGAMTALQLILMALLAASVVVLFACVVPLKRVRLAPDGLLVSNFLKDAVSSARWPGPRPVRAPPAPRCAAPGRSPETHRGARRTPRPRPTAASGRRGCW